MKLISIDKDIQDNIPLLHVVDESLRTERLPTIIFIHGFTSIKEKNLHYAYFLAEKGFRVLLPDAMLHGERELVTERETMFQFWDIVMKTIDELEQLKNRYFMKGLVDIGRVGVAGTSMGGIVTLGAIRKYDWIKAGASLMGSPYLLQFAKAQIAELKKKEVEIPYTNEEIQTLYSKLESYDLGIQPEKIQQRPLLMWHGEQDDVVPIQLTIRFFEEVKKHYEEEQHLLKFIVDKEAGHKVTTKGVRETVAWFEKHLL